MVIIGKILRNVYRDSIAMMRVATEVTQCEGVSRLEIVMGTPTNLGNLKVRHMYSAEFDSATANDTVIAISAADEISALEASRQAEEKLFQKKEGSSLQHKTYFSLEAALHANSRANLVLLSIPGMFVKREALTALYQGANLMIFSDNVPLADEVEIKTLAHEKGLLVMGPDCGTAILNGKGLGFANAVARGPIGIVGASGTGIQEISCLLDQAGEGVSQCIGTGSNDIKEEVGGTSFLKGIEVLEHDLDTQVIVLVSKPPEPSVAKKILARAVASGKPVVVCFLGSSELPNLSSKIVYTATLEETAIEALKLVGRNTVALDLSGVRQKDISTRFQPTQKYIRGLFTGGTLAIESALILQQTGLIVSTNFKVGRLPLMNDPMHSEGHVCLDLGDDNFTLGKPHPMLDPIMRKAFIEKEAADPETAVLLLDFVLGYGVHPEPVAAILPALNKAFDLANSHGRNLVMAASVCGTDADPQVRAKQVELLEQNGCLVFRSNAEATRFAASLVSELRSLEDLND